MSNSISPVILCVDGEHTALWVRALILSAAGYRVLTAANGEEALRMFGLNPVDVVIIDLWQPECKGAEVVVEMKQGHPKVPIILLSGLADLPSGFEQADLVLTKCITPQEFLGAVSSVIGKSRPEGAEASSNDGIG